MAKHRDHDGDGLADRDRGDFTRDDGSSYTRIDIDEFDDYDEVDSLTIVDDGAPD